MEGGRVEGREGEWGSKEEGGGREKGEEGGGREKGEEGGWREGEWESKEEGGWRERGRKKVMNGRND